MLALTIQSAPRIWLSFFDFPGDSMRKSFVITPPFFCDYLILSVAKFYGWKSEKLINYEKISFLAKITVF